MSTLDKVEVNIVEDKAAYFIENKQWEALILLIQEEVASTHSDDLGKIKNWLDSLPDTIKFSNNFLLWLSINLKPSTVHQASSYFYNAFSASVGAKSYSDAFYIWQAQANLKFYYLDRFSDVVGWLDEADKLISVTKLPEDNNIRAMFCVAYFNALIFARPEKQQLNQWEECLLEELLHSENCHIKTSIYNNLIFYNLRMGNMKRAKLLHKEAVGLTHINTQHPFNTIMQSNIFSMVDWLALRTDDAVNIIKKGITHADNIHIKTWHAQLYSQVVYAYTSSGEFKKARASLTDVAKNKDTSQVLDSGQYHYLLGWLNLCEEKLVDAETHLLRALDLSKEAGVLFSEAVIAICLAQAYIAQNKFTEAIKHLARAQWIGKYMGSKHLRFGGLLAQSWLMHAQLKPKKSSLYLSKALHIAAEENIIVINGWPHNIMPTLLEKALHEGIEVKHVKMLISQHKISPTGTYPNHPDWPWQVAISCINDFQLTVQGKIQTQQGKTQRKPIELIKLLTFYPEGLPKYKIANLLYVEEDADKAIQALDTTIFRARKLLKNKKAIIIKKGKYQLNSQLCYSNFMILNKLLKQSPVDFPHEKIDQQFSQVKQLCTNLDNNNDKQEAFWLSTERQLIRQSVSKYLNQCALKASAESKIEILQYILQMDNTVEAAYQNLISAHQQQDQQIEAHKVWNQCQQVFEKIYGLFPSEKTKNLMKQ